MNLFEINQQIADAIEVMYNSADETGEVDTSKFDELNLELDSKIENIALFIKNARAERDAIVAEIKAMKERADKLDRKVESLKLYLAGGMLAAGREKFKSAKTEISFRKSYVTEITDEDKIPQDYKTVVVKEEVKIDKNAIKDAIRKQGIEVPGAIVVENQNINIQ